MVTCIKNVQLLHLHVKRRLQNEKFGSDIIVWFSLHV